MNNRNFTRTRLLDASARLSILAFSMLLATPITGIVCGAEMPQQAPVPSDDALAQRARAIIRRWYESDASFREIDLTATKLMEIVRAQPSNEVAIDCGEWILRRTSIKSKWWDEMSRVLIAHHAPAEGMARICYWLPAGCNPELEPLLRAVLNNNQCDSARAFATFALASLFASMAMRYDLLICSDEVEREASRAAIGDSAFNRIMSQSSALSNEAEYLFGKVSRSGYSDVNGQSFSGIIEPTLGVRASQELFALTRLRVGMKVPEIAGEDVDGNVLKLSSFKGRVVLIDFWSSRFASLADMMKSRRQLREKYGVKNFVVFGVNMDTNRSSMRESCERHLVTWPNIYDNARAEHVLGNIMTRHSWMWNVSLPTSYLVDHLGVIRRREADRPGLDKAIQDALGRANADEGR